MPRQYTDEELLAIRPVNDAGIDVTAYLLSPADRARRAELLAKEADAARQTQALADAIAQAAVKEVSGVKDAILGATDVLASTAEEIANEASKPAREEQASVQSPSAPKRAVSIVYQTLRALAIALLVSLVISTLWTSFAQDVTLPNALTLVLQNAIGAIRNFISAITSAL